MNIAKTIIAFSLFLTSCSMTKDIPADDKLFTGLTRISYWEYDECPHFYTMMKEVDAALATAPNGAIFGSSYYRLSFSFGVSVWNKYADKDNAFARWMTKTFGEQPVLMSWVNPQLRSQVARNVLRNQGYFNGRVEYDTVPQKNPRTMKIEYRVYPGHLYTLDSIGYFDFPPHADSIIHSSLSEANIHSGDPFVVANLDAERQRIGQLLRNNGYYFYQPAYASYLADTFLVDGKAQLRFQLAKDVDRKATHPWYIGRININMRKQAREVLADSLRGRFFTIRFNGKKPPIRPRVVMADLKLRPRQLYTYENHLESMNKINAMGLFSSTDFQFTPRDSSAVCDTMDLTLNCTFDKPWDVYMETNFNARTIGRLGPELKMGVSRRNAFRGGEKIDINVHGSYEWATSAGSKMNNYEYGADASITFPRIIAPFFGGNRVRRDKQGRRIRRQRFATPLTIAKVSTDVIYRPGYYKMHVVSGEWTYRWQPTATSRHELSPLMVKYQFMNSHTSALDSLMKTNVYLSATMSNHFIPEMRYTYTYTSPATMKNPIRWETTLAESGNVTSLIMMALGRKWNDKDKKLFRNPYSQFLKVETDFTKTWTFATNSKLLAHVNAGVIYCYGNSDWVPNSELFYVGGANSIRAFSVRGLGPGRFAGFGGDKALSYLVQNGDIKFVANLEYRQRLFGNLHAAVFLDTGNVWNFDESYTTEDGVTMADGGKFRVKNFLRDLALGTGIGLRYDLNFLILRLDWGIGLHVPYDTGRSGFFNVDGFKRNQTLHFAIGYPF